MMLTKRNRLFEFLFFAILFCFAISLFNLAGYIFSAMVLMMFFFYTSRIRLLSMDLWLILFSVTYFLFYWFHFDIDINVIILYLIGPWAAYIMGHMYMERSTHPKQFMLFLTVLSSGMFLHGFLNIIAYIDSEYFLLYDYTRQAVDFWRRELVNVKTTEMLYIFATGMCMGVLFGSYKVRYKVLSAVVLLLSIVLTVFMANRALLIVIFILFLWRLYCIFKNSRWSLIQKNVIFLSTLSIFGLLIIMISYNIGGLGDFFDSLKIVQRFTSEKELTRFEVWEIFFIDLQFIEHPFGGGFLVQNSDWGYLHNMWLDVYNMVGFIPFLLLLILSLKIFISYLRFNRLMKKTGRENERIVFQSLIIACFLNMMIEPIMEANPYYFLIVLMFFGAMEGYTYKIVTDIHNN